MNAERVVVITERCLGDTVMTLPLIELLESRWSWLSIVARGAPKVLLAGSGRTFIEDDSRRNPWADLRMARALRKHEFDIAVIAKTSFRSAWIARLSGIPRRVGHATEARAGLLTDAVSYERSAYYAFSMLDLARPLGFTVVLQRPRIRLGGDTRKAVSLLQGATIGVQPGASYKEKRLPTNVLAKIVHQLSKQGFRVALIGGPEEVPAAQELCAALDHPVVDLVGRTDLSTLCEMLSGLQLMIGADTGVLHLAAAVGVGTIQVFGPKVYKGWGNAFGSNQVVVAPDGDVSRIEPDKLLDVVSLAMRGVGAQPVAFP